VSEIKILRLINIKISPNVLSFGATDNYLVLVHVKRKRRHGSNELASSSSTARSSHVILRICQFLINSKVQPCHPE
jgi:hypothetical protein